MKLREQFEVAEPVSSVWTFFEQPEAVAQCVPGVEELTVVTPDDIDVRLTQSIGPMTATFAANVRIVERVPEKLIQFTAAGRSVRGAMGNVRATVTVQVEPAGDRTVVMVEGDVVLAGALGSVGQKVAAKQAAKVTAQFSRNLEAALSGGRSRATTVPAASAAGTTAAAVRPLNTGSLPAFTADRSTADPWPKVAAALSAVSVLLSIVALRGSRRRGRR
jgi:carbon monoxide dehydrogenase subunit G